MKLDLKAFKKVKEDKNSATLQHPAGHHIRIAKNVLSPENRKELQKLPMYLADGTPDEPVQDPNASNQNSSVDPSMGPDMSPAPAPSSQAPATVINIATPQAAAPTPMPTPAPTPMPAPQMAPAAAVQAAPQMPVPTLQDLRQPPPATALPPQQNDPFGYKTEGDMTREGMGNVLQGLQGQADAEIYGNKAQASAMSAGITQQQQLYNQMQTNLKAAQTEYQNVVSDAKKNLINPNHLWENRSLPGKIATGIGLIFGGIGGALTHQENPVLKQLNAEIDRDVQAQARNQDTRQNLVNANIKMLGDTNQGIAMSAIQLRGIVADKMKQAALQTNNPLIRARLLQQVGQYETENAQRLGQIALQQTLSQAAGPDGNGGGLTPERRIALLAKTPQEAEAAGKELASLKNHATQVDHILGAFQQANQQNTLAGRASRFGFEPPSVGVFQSLMMPYLKDAEGRINESELQRTDKFIPKVGDKSGTIEIKRQGLMNFLNEKAPVGVLMPRFGIDPHQFGTTSSSGEKKLQLGAPQLRGQ